jgi:hypothetical protein
VQLPALLIIVTQDALAGEGPIAWPQRPHHHGDGRLLILRLAWIGFEGRHGGMLDGGDGAVGPTGGP